MSLLRFSPCPKSAFIQIPGCNYRVPICHYIVQVMNPQMATAYTLEILNISDQEASTAAFCRRSSFVGGRECVESRRSYSMIMSSITHSFFPVATSSFLVHSTQHRPRSTG